MVSVLESTIAREEPVGVSEHPATFTPCLRLFGENLVVNRGGPYREAFEEVLLPVAAVEFDYGAPGGALIRDPVAESAAHALIERYGLVDLECLEDYGDVGSKAQYVVDVDCDMDALAFFGAEVVPKLEEAGWRVEVAPDYPCQLVGERQRWYADIENDTEDSSWFSVELGVEINGERVNLLPVLLDLVEECDDLDALERLSRSTRRLKALPLGNGRFLPVPPERLREILKVVIELYDRDAGPGRLHLEECQSTYLVALETAIEGTLSWRGDVERAIHARKTVEQPGAMLTVPPSGLRATLRPYQRDGLAWLQHLRNTGHGGVLADDMGLGKTLQTIAHLLLEKESGRARVPSLVVCPTSLIGNWDKEIGKFAPELSTVAYHGGRRDKLVDSLDSVDVVLTTYPILARDIELLKERSFHVLVLDEAQTIKNPSSQIHEAVLELDAEHPVCLTGTPIENHLGELWSLFNFLMPGFLGSAERFREIYRDPIEREQSAGRLEALRDRLGPFILRRLKSDVAKDLPPKTELVHRVELTGAQRDLYESIRLAAHERVRKAVKDRGVSGATIEILDALMKLRQVCCDPRLVTMDAARAVRSSAKFEAFFEMVVPQLRRGHRVLVFSQFTSMLKLLSERLGEERISHLTLTGATKNRQSLVDDFQAGNADVFLISLKAGGTGLTLTRADTVIHYDPWWNPAIQAQATDRAYRIGQKNPVFAYNFIVSGSVEERILQMQQRKRELAESLLGGSNAGMSQLSMNEVDTLFAPLDE